ncbi:suppressor of SWI4 1 homolog isoform X2 [Phascolarctos cinereus]|uniref:Suppressor of SWI4 1 homolog isoform X2 n=1 Tax=Phascolarctos cinereus TaxID=38626 RepID=A0A6P5KYY2_PHACI|nr:suppressor of SWI4 1 homolog isoform X2 [Phascolarctos cinereus]
MGRHGKSQHQKRARAAAQLRALEAYASAPHSFVFARGPAGPGVRQLSLDVRRVMEPYTASSLQVRRRNSLKDCVAVAGPLGVSHFLIFSKTEKNVTFRLIRLPGGPTLTFRVTKYSLVRDVVSSLRRHRMHEQQFSHPPLLVLNGFGPHGLHVKLTASVFQNMFPSINVHKVNLNCVKRCLLLSYDPDSQELQFRHYLKVVPVGASRGMKKLLQEKFPDMSRLEDVSELLATGAGLSESEAEPDGEHNVTELPQAYAGRGNMKAEQSAVRLTEIGPRITMQLIKIQEGLGDGSVLYHGLVHKSEEELKATLATRQQKLLLKAERRGRQEQDIKRKEEQREAHRKRSLEGMQRAEAPSVDQGNGDSEAEDPGQPDGGAHVSDEEEDEAEYFRQAVGEEPDEDMFPKVKRRRPNRSPGQPVSGDQRPQNGRGRHPKGRFRAAKGRRPKGATARHFSRSQALGRALASRRPHHKSAAAAAAART